MQKIVIPVREEKLNTAFAYTAVAILIAAPLLLNLLGYSFDNLSAYYLRPTDAQQDFFYGALRIKGWTSARLVQSARDSRLLFVSNHYGSIRRPCS
jgi:hypothetical protein